MQNVCYINKKHNIYYQIASLFIGTVETLTNTKSKLFWTFLAMLQPAFSHFLCRTYPTLLSIYVSVLHFCVNFYQDVFCCVSSFRHSILFGCPCHFHHSVSCNNSSSSSLASCNTNKSFSSVRFFRFIYVTLRFLDAEFISHYLPPWNCTKHNISKQQKHQFLIHSLNANKDC